MQDLVVLRHGDAEDDRRDVLEAVDPLLPLRSLSPDVEQPEEIDRQTEVYDRSFYNCPIFCNFVGFGRIT